MKTRFFLISFFCLANALFSASSEERAFTNMSQSVAVQEVQIQLEDLLHKIHCLEADLRLLEQRIFSQEEKLKKEIVVSQESKEKKEVEKKLVLLEEKQEKVTKDIHQISSHANEMVKEFSQTEERIQSLENKLKDIGKLKTTLDGVAKKIKEASSEGCNIYKVKAGDSLDKVARLHKVSIESVKRLNHLEKDLIVVGQELKIPQS